MKKAKAYQLFAMLILLGLTVGGLWSARAQEPGPSELAPNQAPPPYNAPRSTVAGEFKPGEVIVKFKDGVSGSSVDGAPSRYNATQLRSLYGGQVGLWRVPEGQELAVVAQLNTDPLVEYAEPNYVYYAFGTPNDPGFGKQWAHAKMQSAAAWNISTGSTGIVIAIVDTGIDETHPDLAGKIVSGWDYVDGDNDPHDLNGHGTHVAGIAAAVTNNGIGVAGMDWQARIMPVRVLDSLGRGYASDIISGIGWAYQHGADVINLSLGGPGYSQAMQDAINNAHTAGSLVVAAMGNCRIYDPPNCGDNPTEYPAAYDNVMAVAATGPTDTYAYYSQYGAHCDIAAPGGAMGYLHDPDGIYSTLPTYPVVLTQIGYYQSYDYLQGTSMATPYVAGLAALVWSVDPTLTPDQVQTTIEDNAVELGAPGWDSTYGWGRIDAVTTLQAALPVPAPPALAPIDNPERDGNYLVDWNDVPSAASYTLQQDDASTFPSPTLRYSGPSSQFSVSNQGGGTWFYRVLASNAAGDSLWSNTESVTVIVPPAAPILYAISNPTSDDAYQISWSAVVDATGYRLEQANNPSFTSSVVRYAGTAVQYNVTAQPNGTWYYRVLAYNSAGDSPWSNAQSTTVTVLALPAPLLNPISNSDGDGQYNVTWSIASGATSYTLEQSRSSYFETSTEVYSGGDTQYPVTNQPGGTWYYRVRAFGPAGKSPWSNQRSVNVTAWVYLPLLVRNLSLGGSGLSINEGFEGGLVPPSGWTLLQTNPDYTWRIVPGAGFAYEGQYYAVCDWDFDAQDEVLLSPEFQASGAQLEFHSFGSVDWCRDDPGFDFCDLNVWLVVGGWDGGTGDDIQVYTADQDWTGELVWSRSSVNLTPYLPAGTPVRIGFEYKGQDGEQIGLDAIQISGQ